MLENIAHTDGENTTLMLACATGGATDAKLKAVQFDWEKLKSRLKKPKVGQKDGPYYVRGGELAGERRTTENLLSGELIILDGDSSIDPETGEITPGAPPMASVCDALSDMGITYFAHTSHSFQKGKLEKYRVIIPAKLKSEAELNASVDYLIAQLHAKQIWLADVNENHKWIQPWFFSRVRDEQAAGEFCHREHTGKKFDVKLAVSYNKELQRQEAVEKSAVNLHTQTQNGEGNIQKFNHSCDISYVRGLIEQAGYRFCFYQKGKDAYKYIRPGSESGQPGLTIMRGTQGDWCVYSHHGSGIVPPNRFLDPFALTAIVKHGGDMKAAARSLIPKGPSILEQLSERAAMQYREPAPSQTPANDVQSAPEGKQPRKLEIIKASELVDVSVKWLVEDLIPADSLSVLYGTPGSFKSFVALYICGMIASGKEAFGKPTEVGSVLYIAAEGQSGLKRRKEALFRQHAIPKDAPVYFIKAQVDLFNALTDRDLIVEAIRQLNISPKMIVVDTFARTTPGMDENSVKETGVAINVLSSIQEEFNCTILLVTHAGKDTGRGIRGSSAILGAADSVLECNKIGENATERLGRISSQKQKDGQDGLAFVYKMNLIQLSDIDADATSLALMPVEGKELEDMQTKKAKASRLKGNNLEAFNALKTAINDAGSQPPIGDRAPKGTKAVRRELWMATWETKTALEKEAFKKAKQRTPQTLVEIRAVDTWSGWVWIVEEQKKSPSFDSDFPGDQPSNYWGGFEDIPFD